MTQRKAFEVFADSGQFYLWASRRVLGLPGMVLHALPG